MDVCALIGFHWVVLTLCKTVCIIYIFIYIFIVYNKLIKPKGTDLCVYVCYIVTPSTLCLQNQYDRAVLLYDISVHV